MNHVRKPFVKYMFTNLRLIYLLFTVFLLPSVCLAGGHFKCTFLKKTDVMSNMITDENSVQRPNDNLDLATIFSGPVFINVDKESENCTILAYESTQAIKLKIFSRLKNTIFAIRIEDKFTTLFTDS